MTKICSIKMCQAIILPLDFFKEKKTERSVESLCKLLKLSIKLIVWCHPNLHKTSLNTKYRSLHSIRFDHFLFFISKTQSNSLKMHVVCCLRINNFLCARRHICILYCIVNLKITSNPQSKANNVEVGNS